MSDRDEHLPRSASSRTGHVEGLLETADSHDDSHTDAMLQPEYALIEPPSHLLQDEETTRDSVPYQLQPAGEENEDFVVPCPYPTPLPSRASSPAERRRPPIKPKHESNRFWSTPNGFNLLGDSDINLLPAQQMSQNLFVGIMQLTPRQSQFEVISSSPESLAPITPVRNNNVTERGTFNMETPVDYEKSAALDFGREMLHDLDDLLAAEPIVDPAYDSILPKSPSAPGSPLSPSLRQHAVASRRNTDHGEDSLAASERTLDDELLDFAESAEVWASKIRTPFRDASAVQSTTGVGQPAKKSLSSGPRHLHSTETRQGHRHIPTPKTREQAHGAAAASATKVEVIVLGEPSPYEAPTATQFEKDLQTGAAKVIKLLSDQPAPCHWACIRTKPVLQGDVADSEVRPRARRTSKKQKRTRDAWRPVGGTGFVEEVPSTQDQPSLEQMDQQCGAKGKAEFSQSSTPDGLPAPATPQEANKVSVDAFLPVITAQSAAHEEVSMQDVGTKVEVKQDDFVAAAAVKMAVPASHQVLNMEKQLPVATETAVVEDAARNAAQIIASLTTSMSAPTFGDGHGKDTNVKAEGHRQTNELLPQDIESSAPEVPSAKAIPETNNALLLGDAMPALQKTADSACQADFEPWPCAEPGCNRPSERCLINARNLGRARFPVLNKNLPILHSSTSVSPVGSPYCWRCRLEHKTHKKRSTCWTERATVRKQAEASWLVEERRRIEQRRADGRSKRALKTAAKRKRATMQIGDEHSGILPKRLRMEAVHSSINVALPSRHAVGSDESQAIVKIFSHKPATTLSSANDDIHESDVPMVEANVEDERLSADAEAGSNAESAVLKDDLSPAQTSPMLCEAPGTFVRIASAKHRDGPDMVCEAADATTAPLMRDQATRYASEETLPATNVKEAHDALLPERPASPRPSPLKPKLQPCERRHAEAFSSPSPPLGTSLLLAAPLVVDQLSPDETLVSEHLHVAEPSTAADPPSPITIATFTSIHDSAESSNSSPRTSSSSSRYASHTPSPLRSVQTVQETPPSSPTPHMQISSIRGRELISTPPPEPAFVATTDANGHEHHPPSLSTSTAPLEVLPVYSPTGEEDEEEEADAIMDPLASSILQAFQNHRHPQSPHDSQLKPLHLHFCSCGTSLARFAEKLPCRQCMNEEFWRILNEMDREGDQEDFVAGDVDVSVSVMGSNKNTSRDEEVEKGKAAGSLGDLCRVCRSLVVFDEQGLCVPCANPMIGGLGGENVGEEREGFEAERARKRMKRKRKREKKERSSGLYGISGSVDGQQGKAGDVVKGEGGGGRGRGGGGGERGISSSASRQRKPLKGILKRR
ncbi:hypothetical protein CERZMDRAFT_97341 [Cercospora zeae-maydis SCOH1-5]|uniref:Uncharacterized protein n=1 Tax=Cercospora zeae-maydis SCOH1-5 TaxID=717836 RepID=A0A6A6FHL1_9PEZI|nr:hypothetical protein CERZMDRAFT_97341 [Cercospora zeae-maydis SCOH1-5]